MTRHHPLKILCVALASAGLSGAAFAQLPMSASPPPSQAPSPPIEPIGAHPAGSTLSHGDRKFIEDAARDGMAEIELGKLAQQHAASDQAKQLGSKMIQDHGKAGDELRRIAEAKGVKMPTEPSMMQRHEADKFSKLNGGDFDKAYADAMVKDHEKAVKTFTKESTEAKDPDVRSFAAQTLPTLKEHLQLAQAAQQAAGGRK